MVLPVFAITRPSALAGMVNGQIPASRLVSTPGQAGGPTVVLVEPAARAWRALCASAKVGGHTLKLSGAASGYRTIDQQVTLFRQRFTTSPVSSTVRIWQGRRWFLRPGVALAAVPGTSNHGNAIAVDVGVELDGDTGTESIDAGALEWLLGNASRFGWSWEVQSEPWHLRYYPGDLVPVAVLAYERDVVKPSAIPQEEIDMLIVTCTGKPTRLLAPPTCAEIDAKTLVGLKAAGVKSVAYTAAAYDKLLRHVGDALGRAN